MRKNNKKIAVIGAGIAGLSCAYELKKAGFTVTVYEKSAEPGGRMATRFKDGFQFNPGATLLSENYDEFKKYGKEFGIDFTPMLPASRHRVIRAGRSFPYGKDVAWARPNVVSLQARLKVGFWLLKTSLTRVFGNFFDLSSTDKSLDFNSAGSYLRGEIGDEAVDYLIDPFCAALHFYGSDKMSTSAVFTLLKMLRTPGDFSSRHPAGGVAAIPKALAKSLNIKYQSKIQSVESLKKSADVIVLACPAPAALPLLKNPSDAQKTMLSAINYASTIVVSFQVPADLFADRTHCIYVPYVENQIVSCVMFEGVKGSDLIYKNRTLLNVYLHDEAAKKLIKKSDRQIVAIVQAELFKVCPEAKNRQQEIGYHDLARWPIAMPTFEHQIVSVVSDFVHNHQGEGGIYFAGDYLNSPWTEGAARSGKRAAEAIIKRFS